jgi:hypothetical protein
MRNLVLPHPDVLIARIKSCEEELRQLKRLLTVSKRMRVAEEERRRREAPLGTPLPKGGAT